MVAGLGRTGRIGRWLVGLSAMIVVAAACTGGNTDAEEGPRIRSQLADPADLVAAGDPGGAGPSDGADAVQIEPSSIEPTDTFQRLDGNQFGNVSSEISIEDAIMFDDDSWLVAGAIEDGRARTSTAVVGVLSSSDPELNRQVVLPSNGADQASAFGLSRVGDVIRVVGRTDRAGRSTAVVWTGDAGLDEWAVEELPSDRDDQIQAYDIVDGAEVTYLLGSVTIDGFSRPVAWRSGSGAWISITVEAEPERNVSLFDGVEVDGTLVTVGSSTGAIGDPKPVIWIDDGAVLNVAAGIGLPSGGLLTSVIEGPDGELIAVGASTVDAISSPLVATANRPTDRWVIQSPEIDIAGWTSFDGLQFQEVALDGNDLLASLTNPVVQQLSRSSDGGRTWERIGNLGLSAGNLLPANGLAVGAAGKILVAGGDVAMERSGADWEPIADQDVNPSQLGAFLANDVVAGPAGFYIGGGQTSRSANGLAYEAVVWQSPDGVSWGRPPLTEPEIFSIYDMLIDSDGRAVALKGGGGFFNIAGVERPEASGRWGSTPLQLGEAFLFDAKPGLSGTIIAGGIRPNEEVSLIDPLFVIIEADDSVREIPLTDSPIDENTNAEVTCIAGEIGGLLAVVEWGDGQVGVVAGPNGERWSGVTTTGLTSGLDITSCHGDADGFIMGGRDGTGAAVVATSSDGADWTVTVVADQAGISGIDQIEGQVYLSGWRVSDGGLGTDGTVWRSAGGGWEPIDDAGLASDGFAEATQITGLAAKDGIVVAIGTDRGRAGAWVATTAALTN